MTKKVNKDQLIEKIKKLTESKTSRVFTHKDIVDLIAIEIEAYEESKNR